MPKLVPSADFDFVHRALSDAIEDLGEVRDALEKGNADQARRVVEDAITARFKDLLQISVSVLSRIKGN